MALSKYQHLVKIDNNIKMTTYHFKYLKLLVWKNFKIKSRHKVALAAEIILPLLFFLVLFLFKMVEEREEIAESTIYRELDIRSLQILHGKSVYNYSVLAYAPQNEVNDKIIAQVTSDLNLSGQGFKSSSQMDSFMQNNNIFFGVLFKSSDASLPPKKFDFTMRIPPNFGANNEEVEWDTTNIFGKSRLEPRHRNRFADYGGEHGYIAAGLATVQYAITNAYIKVAAKDGGAVNIPRISMQRFPYPPYVWDGLAKDMPMLLTMMSVMGFACSFAQIIRQVTAEKQNNIKETMKIMGLKSIHHWGSWFVQSFVILGLIMSLVVFILKYPFMGTPVINAASWALLLIFFYCYAVAIIGFAFLMTSFFSKPGVASVLSLIVWFLTLQPYQMVSGQSSLKISTTIKILMSPILNTGFGFGIDSILEWELAGGAQMSNLFRPPSTMNTLSVGVTMLCMLVNAAIYMLLTIYLEMVFPGEHGYRYPWYFPCRKTFWCPGKSKKISAEDMKLAQRSLSSNSDNFEDDPANASKKAGIRLHNLTKAFDNKLAVIDLRLDMYENEITALLGHNGAGKSTTISMITGFLMPTAGRIEVDGFDTSRNMAAARKNLGICPQQDILFDDLTVWEHFVFFSRLKGVEDPTEIEAYLTKLNLKDKRDALSNTLSGGMKRKLSLGLALCGRSKVVLCDEPSSGMDPQARRELWELLEAEKVGRTILLTTHYMDEADVLGDRIAIMSAGSLVCVGTSFFLKKKFGIGYTLICDTTPQCNPNNVTAVIRKYIPDATIKSNIGAELKYNLAEIHIPCFEALLSELEGSQGSLGLQGYGITTTTLEDVFLATGNSADTLKEKDDAFVKRSIGFDSEGLGKLVRGKKHVLNIWEAMFLKKFLTMKRNWIIPVIQVLFPIILLALSASGGSLGLKSTPPELKISLDSYGMTESFLSSINGSSVGVAYREQFDTIKDHHKLTTTDKDIKDVIIDLGEKTIDFSGDTFYVVAATVSDEKCIAWFNNEVYHTVPLSLNLLQNAVVKKVLGKDHSIGVSVHPLPYTVKERVQTSKLGGLQIVMSLSFALSIACPLFIIFIVRERVTKAKLLQFIAGTSPLVFWLSHLIVDMLVCVVMSAGIIAVCMICQFEEFQTKEALAAFILILFLFSLASLTFIYLWSFFCKTGANGVTYLVVFNILIGSNIVIATIVLRLFFTDEESETRIFLPLRIVSLFIPLYAISDAVLCISAYIGQQKICAEIAKQSTNLESFFSFFSAPVLDCDKGWFSLKYPGLGLSILILVLSGGLYFVLIILLDTYMSKIRNIKNICRPKRPSENFDSDNDVRDEMSRVHAMSQEDLKQETLVMRGLTKFYGKFLAVNNLSVGVKGGECFGLLGVNGAGKTSAFKMLTGDENLSYGEVWIGGHSIENEPFETCKLIGYCPQYDALLLEMTGYELLKIFCMIRGFPKNEIKDFVDALADDLDFTKHLHKKSEKYSGGNRRKLSTALAILGEPRVIFLDEPTAGIDPASRRKLWNIVSSVRGSGKGIILTSHSMEECEALCTRIAIMVNGEFMCLGSTQHLKTKFSRAILLSVNLKKVEQGQLNMDEGVSQMEENITDFVTRTFPGATLKERRPGLLTFDIALDVMPYSRIFGIMEKNKAQLNIQDYSVTQPSLEQIFIQLANQQRVSADT